MADDLAQRVASTWSRLPIDSPRTWCGKWCNLGGCWGWRSLCSVSLLPDVLPQPEDPTKYQICGWRRNTPWIKSIRHESEEYSDFCFKWRDFLPIRWIRRIGENHPCINWDPFTVSHKQGKILVQLLEWRNAKQVTWVQSLTKSVNCS